MSSNDNLSPSSSRFTSFVEKVGKKIPDPIIIFMWFLVGGIIITALIGGLTFETMGADGGTIQHTIKDMTDTENVIWMFDNALVRNWLAFGKWSPWCYFDSYAGSGSC